MLPRVTRITIVLTMIRVYTMSKWMSRGMVSGFRVVYNGEEG